MAAQRTTKSQARRNTGKQRSSGGISAPMVFVGGAVVAAAILFGAPRLLKEHNNDFLKPKPNADAEPKMASGEQQVVADGAGVVAKNGTAPAKAAGAKQGTEYDFYTVLPNKEVEMTPAQQAALNRAQAFRNTQAQAAAQRQAEFQSQMAANGGTGAPAAPAIFPEDQPAAPKAALPQPVNTSAPAVATPKPALPKPVTASIVPRSAPVATFASRPATIAPTIATISTRPAQRPSGAMMSNPDADAPVARVRTNSVPSLATRAAATTAANAPKPKAKALAGYGKTPDVTAVKKGVAMVMPASSVRGAMVVASNAKPSKSKLLLQAGAYGNQTQAEQVKAKIALLGLGARVESSKQAGKSVYRVRLGPYAEASSDLDAVKRKLSNGGVSAMEVHIN